MSKIRTLIGRLTAVLPLATSVQASAGDGVGLAECTRVANAKATITIQRPREFALTVEGYVPAYRDAAGELVAGRRWVWSETAACDVPDPRDVVTLSVDETSNVKTNGGIDFTHTQTYGTAPAANGLNYIALSNDAVSETSASTTLSTEIAANGLSRAQGTVTHTNGQTTTTVAKTFTCATAPQAAQKAALFTASSAGTMHHVLAFTQRSLQIGDTLTITFTLTIS